jgi:predicted nucleotidyltransferase component of viral defense system
MSEVFTPIELFREAVSFTNQRYRFPERLIEKDYVCTIILEFLMEAHPDLVFKGGTCLTKIYTDFYRMSEDLDFVIPMSVDAPRSARSARARKLAHVIAALPQKFPFARVAAPLRGANNSTQYNATIGYNSAIGGREESIKIEISLREPLLLPHFAGEAKTLLLDPASGNRLIPLKNVRCIARTEAFAEKFRAALSRRGAAVRNFFDLDYAVRTLGLYPDDANLIKLVRQKMSITKTDRIDVSDTRLSALRQQVEPQLRSVLRAEEFAAFDLQRSIDLVVGMAAKIK